MMARWRIGSTAIYLHDDVCSASNPALPATKERIPEGWYETARALTLTANHCGLTPASSSKLIFSMSKKSRSPYPASRAQAQKRLAMTISLAHPNDCGGSDPLRTKDCDVQSGLRKEKPSPWGNPWQARASGDHFRWMRVSCHHWRSKKMRKSAVKIGRAEYASLPSQRSCKGLRTPPIM